MSPIRTGAFGDPGEKKEEQEQPKPAAKKAAAKKRRSKAELIEAARIPADDEVVEVRFEATGTKGQRPWSEAAELFRQGKISFVDKTGEVSLKYSVEKLDQQAGEPGDGVQPAPEEGSLASKIPTDQKTGSFLAPPGAALGDEVYVGTERYYVGHEGLLIQNPPAIEGGEDGMKIVEAERSWKIEPGTGAQEWRSEAIKRGSSAPASSSPINESAFAEAATAISSAAPSSVTVQSERVADEIVQLPTGDWKVGTGLLEKIGLPDYSGLQIGPNTMSSTVADDGRRMEVELPAPNLPGGKRKAIVATAAVEKYELLADTVEYVTRLQRGHLIAFLEAVKPGSTSAPMNSSAPVSGSYS